MHAAPNAWAALSHHPGMGPGVSARRRRGLAAFARRGAILPFCQAAADAVSCSPSCHPWPRGRCREQHWPFFWQGRLPSRLTRAVLGVVLVPIVVLVIVLLYFGLGGGCAGCAGGRGLPQLALAAMRPAARGKGRSPGSAAGGGCRGHGTTGSGYRSGIRPSLRPPYPPCCGRWPEGDTAPRPGRAGLRPEAPGPTSRRGRSRSRRCAGCRAV